MAKEWLESLQLYCSWKFWNNQSLLAVYAERVDETSSMGQVEPLERLHFLSRECTRQNVLYLSNKLEVL
jgi:hypothetical protein